MDENLSRRERRKLLREDKKEGKASGGFLKKAIFIFIGLLLIGGGGFWLFGETSKPLPGEAVTELGRDHVDDIFGVEYSSNPPTSGTHFPIWAKKGVYDRLISNGYLIHSLEHGYIVLSYDCTKNISSSFSLVREALAHDEPPIESSPDSGQLLMHMKLTPSDTMSGFTPQNPPEVEVPLPESFNSDACKRLQSDLASLVDFRERVVVVPRVNQDNAIAATAWGRILKLDNFDKAKLEEFIAAFHNKGPEQTVE